MAQSRSRRGSRRKPGAGARRPRAVSSSRREQRALEQAAARRLEAAARRPGAVGERPPSPFAGMPVSEAAIAIGLVGLLVGYFTANPAAMAAGAVICGLGVVEVTAREHFSGYRSHCALLAAVPAVAVETGIVLVFGEPSDRMLLIVPVVPVFALCFWLLRRSFESARHARVARPPAP